jgi:hypothetical protein
MYLSGTEFREVGRLDTKSRQLSLSVSYALHDSKIMGPARGRIGCLIHNKHAQAHLSTPKLYWHPRLIGRASRLGGNCEGFTYSRVIHLARQKIHAFSVFRKMFTCSKQVPWNYKIILSHNSFRFISFIMNILSRFFALTALTKIGYAFNLYPPVDPSKLATAYNISLDCLNAL